MWSVSGTSHRVSMLSAHPVLYIRYEDSNKLPKMTLPSQKRKEKKFHNIIILQSLLIIRGRKKKGAPDFSNTLRSSSN